MDGARRCFAEMGYERSTNRDLADRAGLTTGAIYHYFDSKLDLYAAVHAEIQDLVYDRFEKAAAPETTFLASMEAVIDAAGALNVEDPSIAQFLMAARVDARRHRDIDDAIRSRMADGNRFFADIADLGVDTGEVDPDDRDQLLSVITATLMGLAGDLSARPREHRLASDGLKRLLRSNLVRSV